MMEEALLETKEIKALENHFARSGIMYRKPKCYHLGAIVHPFLNFLAGGDRGKMGKPVRLDDQFSERWYNKVLPSNLCEPVH